MKILVVEDEPQQMELTQYWLRKAGHEAVGAATAAEAMAMPERFDVVLCDYRLEHPFTARDVRSARASLAERFIVISGSMRVEGYEGEWAMKPTTVTLLDQLLGPHETHESASQ